MQHSVKYLNEISSLCRIFVTGNLSKIEMKCKNLWNENCLDKYVTHSLPFISKSILQSCHIQQKRKWDISPCVPFACLISNEKSRYDAADHCFVGICKADCRLTSWKLSMAHANRHVPQPEQFSCIALNSTDF